MPNAPFGGTLDEQAAWANENINSNFGVEAWKAVGPMDSGCPPDYPYRSQRAGGDNACVEHPDNCPHGKTLHGSSCIPWEQANQMFGGGYGPGAGAPATQPPPNPLAGMMAGVPQAPAAAPGMPQIEPWAGGFRDGPNLQQALAPYQTPQVSATQNLLATATAPGQARPNVGGVSAGWTQGADGLQQTMARLNRRPNQLGAMPNGTGGAWWA